MRHFCAALFLVACAHAADLSGTWAFTHVNDRFRGTITLRQLADGISGTWHTSQGKTEADTPIAGRVSGSTVTFTRTIGNLQQKYVLTLSEDGTRLDGYGDGWGIHHDNLNMQRYAAAPVATSPAKMAGHLSLPPDRTAYRWAFQSVAMKRGNQTNFVRFYYEAATDKSASDYIPLAQGAQIIAVFPGDCAFAALNDRRETSSFSGQDDSRGKSLAPGTWTFYPTNPTKCSGVVVFLK